MYIALQLVNIFPGNWSIRFIHFRNIFNRDWNGNLSLAWVERIASYRGEIEVTILTKRINHKLTYSKDSGEYSGSNWNEINLV